MKVWESIRVLTHHRPTHVIIGLEIDLTDLGFFSESEDFWGVSKKLGCFSQIGCFRMENHGKPLLKVDDLGGKPTNFWENPPISGESEFSLHHLPIPGRVDVSGEEAFHRNVGTWTFFLRGQR